MITKKLISLILTAAIAVSIVPIVSFAEEDTEKSVDIESIAEEMGIGVDYSGFDPEATQEPYSNEPEEHTEIVNGDIKLPEADSISNTEQDGISLFSTDNSDIWNELMTSRFGDAYLSPWKKSDGQKVSGNTNRLVIEETDLTIPGKNGLDVVIRRKHDNQYYNEIYSAVMRPLSDGYEDVYNQWYVYAFKTLNNNIYYIGFATKDDFHTYMENGLTISEFPTKSYNTTTREGEEIKLYFFPDIYDKKSSSGTTLIYDSSKVSFKKNVRSDHSTRYKLYTRPIMENRNQLGSNWSLQMPEACLYAYESDTDSGDTKTTQWDYYVGTFRDIDGGVHEIEGYDKFIQSKEGDSTFKSSLSTPNNKYLTVTQYLTKQTISGTDISYNFVIKDSGRGLTYYMNNVDVTDDEIETIQSIYVVAVRDRFNNTIKYEYTANNSLVGIIDTYGRRISISSVTGGKEISYTDENNRTQTIKYISETLDASTLDNDSPIKSKPVNRFKVTNAAGETTIYDARETEVVSFLHYSANVNMNDVPNVYGLNSETSTNSNIERIIYPTGAETRYRYKCVYVKSTASKTAQGVYAVEDSYDIVDNIVKNHKTYTLDSDYGAVTKTESEVTKGAKTVYSYDKEGLLTKSVLSANGTTASKPYLVTTYKYAKDRQLSSVAVNNSGVTTTTSYGHTLYYPGSLTSEAVGDKKITYTYHTIDGKLTNIPQIVNTQYKSGTKYETDTSVETTIDSCGAVEYERTVKDGSIKAQKKYSHDEYGRVTGITMWYSDTNGDGVLDENDDTVSGSRSYTDGTNISVTSSVTGITDADGNAVSDVTATCVYTPLGQPLSITDSNGYTTSAQYDGIGRIKKYTYPNGSTETMNYYTSSCRTKVKDRSGKFVTIHHETSGKPTARFLDSSGGMYEFTGYDDCDRPLYHSVFYDSSRYKQERYTYDVLDRISSKTMYYGSKVLYKENYIYSVSGSNSIVTKHTEAADGTAVADEKCTYNNLGWLIKKEIGSGSGKMTYSYTYDYKGNMLTETDPNGNETQYTYDHNNNITKIFYPDIAWEFKGYDMMGRMLVEYDRELTSTRYTYDKLNRVTDIRKNVTGSSNAHTKRYYDANSNLIKESIQNNPQGDTSEATFTTTEYVYDNMNNMIGTKVNDGEKTNAVRYWYDKADRVTAMATGLSSIPSSSVPSGESLTRYSYNVLGYLEKETDALGQSVSYTYDLTGNVTAKTDRNGAVTTNTYQAYGATMSSITDGSNTEKYIYTYNDLGMQTSAKLYNGSTLKDTVTSTYDEFGRKLTETSNGKTNKYSYDPNSNVINYQLLDGDTVKNDVEYTYNEMNWLTEADCNDIITSYTYNDNGNIVKKTIKDYVTTVKYNSLDLPTSYETKVGNGVLSSYTYTYSVDGNRISENDTVNNINRTYEYDGAGRLSKETQSGAVDRVTSYTYDLRGNRTKETVTGDENYVVTNTYDVNNRLTDQTKTVDGSAAENIKYYYDANGNRTFKQVYSYSQGGLMSVQGGSYQSGTVESFTYDLQNQLTGYQSSSTTVSYSYGANGLRKRKSVGGKTTGFVWDRGNVAAEMTGSTITNMYNYGPDGITEREKSNGEISIYLKNAHGDVTGISDEYGIPEERYQFDAFGNIQTETEPAPFGYCGEYRDAESGLIYLRNRYYDTETGRFITEDPVKDGTNWYVYAANNPVMRVDPTGLWGGDLHYNMTQWIYAEFGLNSYHANVVANANKETDSNWNTSPFNPNSAGRHFDRDTNPNIDSRRSYAEACYSDAVNTWNRADELYNNGEIDENQRHDMRVQALESLGRGLHSLQDIDAHLDYNEGDESYSAHHTGLLTIPSTIKNFDNPRYDIYKDESGIYYTIDSNSEYGSTRYSNSVNLSRNYIYNFYVDTGQRGW